GRRVLRVQKSRKAARNAPCTFAAVLGWAAFNTGHRFRRSHPWRAVHGDARAGRALASRSVPEALLHQCGVRGRVRGPRRASARTSVSRPRRPCRTGDIEIPRFYRKSEEKLAAIQASENVAELHPRDPREDCQPARGFPAQQTRRWSRNTGLSLSTTRVRRNW